MKMKRSSGTAATLVASASLLLGLATAVPAQAASTAVPNCVKSSVSSNWYSIKATATNKCSTTKRFYFKWDRHVDGPCKSLSSGSSRWEQVAITSRFAGFGSC